MRLPELRRSPGFTVVVGGPVPRGASGITLGRFVVLRRGRERDPRLLAHELVHVEQWRRHGVVGFGVRYVWHYLRWRALGYPHWSAYRRIPAECEADWRSRVGPPARL